MAEVYILFGIGDISIGKPTIFQYSQLTGDVYHTSSSAALVDGKFCTVGQKVEQVQVGQA